MASDQFAAGWSPGVRLSSHAQMLGVPEIEQMVHMKTRFRKVTRMGSGPLAPERMVEPG